MSKDFQPLNNYTTTSLAVVSGGSSGIGLACAKLLIAWGHPVALLSRDLSRLEAARKELLTSEPSAQVELCAVDVTNRLDVEETVASLADAFGRPTWLVASAGEAIPGEFLHQDIGDHERQMAVNYFGTLYLARAVAPLMASSGQGRIVLIASAVAIGGVYGYASYAPSKFAVRGLGEVLDTELSGFGISVTVAYPPDTQTPQLEAERPLRPHVTRIIAGSAPTVSADFVARKVLTAAKRGHFIVAPTLPILFFHWFQGIVARLHRHVQKRLARRYSPEHELDQD